MNAIHYCIYREEMTSNKRAGKAVRRIMHLIPRYCFPKRMRMKLCKQLQNTHEIKEYKYDKLCRPFIGRTHYIFGFFYSCYPGLISWIFLGITDKEYSGVDDLIFVLVFGVPIAIGYIPVYRVVFIDNIYLRYYKRFENEDEVWHKKWKWITIAFCIGGILTSVIGFLCMAILSSL